MAVTYRGNGAKSLSYYQETGDLKAKNYAVEWYRLAYALKPSADLEERINRMRGGTPTTSKTRTNAPKNAPRKAGSVIFAEDEELKNRNPQPQDDEH